MVADPPPPEDAQMATTQAQIKEQVECCSAAAAFLQISDDDGNDLSNGLRAAAINLVYLSRSLAAAEARAQGLEAALRCLYEETADYIRLNHLGDVHHNRSMQLARDALARPEPEGK